MFKIGSISYKDNYKLPYDFAALEPYISAEANKQHYDGHLMVYFEKLRKLIETKKLFVDLNIQDIIINSYGSFEIIDIYNFSSQIYAHILFWESIGPNDVSDQIGGTVKEYIEKSFGSIDKFKTTLIEKGLALFGNGWLWLVLNDKDELELIATVNAFNPINIDYVSKILLCIDLWEHAYYLQYKHLRKTYLENIYKIINWNKVLVRLNS